MFLLRIILVQADYDTIINHSGIHHEVKIMKGEIIHPITLVL
jgi:hypothetical protein